MSKEIILITGGARSGKSQYAERRALEMGGRMLYLATAEAKDEEMVRRIAEHPQTARQPVAHHRGASGIDPSASGGARQNRLRAGGLFDSLDQQSFDPARR